MLLNKMIDSKTEIEASDNALELVLKQVKEGEEERSDNAMMRILRDRKHKRSWKKLLIVLTKYRSRQ